MASHIETQARQELQDLEGIVTAVESLTNIAASLQPQDMNDYAFLAGFLGTELQRQFQAFHLTVSRQLLPLVADIKTVQIA